MSQTSDDLRARLEKMGGVPRVTARPEPEGQITPAAVGAVRITNAQGVYWRRRTVYDPCEPWGETVLQGDLTAALDTGLRVPFDDHASRLPLDKLLYVDCETTGLSGGAGTVSFLTAVGQYCGDEFVVDQYFLPEPADEAAVLADLDARFAEAGGLVTYNGSSFDLPLLEGRFCFWRLEPNFRALPHLDLLWPTRALFRGRIGECNLGNVEARILRYARVEDLPGSEVPEVYFQYLRDGTSPLLHAVFEHNRLDVVSLFAYSLYLDSRTDAQAPGLADPDDLASLARLWYRRRQYGAALAALRAAQERVLGRSQKAQIAELQALILKRQGDYDLAHEAWAEVAKRARGRPDIAEELAKHLEHRKRDFAAALVIVDQALEGLRFQALTGGNGQQAMRESLQHRRARLKRKLARLQDRPQAAAP